MSRRLFLLLLVVLTGGFAVRVWAFHWNWFMHADVMDDAIVAASIYRDGRLTVYEGPKSADPADFLLPASGGEPLKMHGPLLSALGAAVTAARGGGPSIADAYISLRILSLLFGTLVILVVFFVTSRILDAEAGLAAAAWTASSYLLIDYSGNGALYSYQALVYLLWVLAAYAKPTRRRALLFGVLAGVGYLVNFQCLLLVPASLVVVAFQERPWKRAVRDGLLLTGVTLLLIAPWLIRNAMVFGDALYPHTWQMQYVYTKAGITSPVGELVVPTLGEKLAILEGAIRVWIPNNLYYAVRKLFILVPFAFFLFSFELIDVAFSRERLRRLYPLLVLFFCQLLIYASWPIWKFRFFVPLLPFIFILALEELWHLPISRTWRHGCVLFTFGCIVAVSVLMYRAYPTHTIYYDGALTQDPFHSSEEKVYLQRYGLLPTVHAL